MKTLQLQTRADIQGNQNQVQACATKIAGFDILQLLIEKRKSTGFKSVQVNCWEINQVKSKCQMDTLDKSCETGQTKKKMNINIKFYIFEMVQVLNFSLN